MLHIILLILKIIGIILLCILGILLFAIVCALFVPVRYRIRLVREEGEGKPPFTAYAKVTWLLHLVNILVRYPADVIVRVRIMLFTLFRMPKKEKKGRKKAKKPEKETETKAEPSKQEVKEHKSSLQPATIEENDRVEANVTEKQTQKDDHYEAFDSNFSGLEETTDTEQESETEDDSSSKEKISLMRKIREIINKIKQFVEKIKALFENIQYTIRKFCDKIKSVLDNIEYYRGVLEGEPFKQSLQLCQRELKSVFKALKPAKFKVEITVGMEDPATTGQILAIYGMLYPFIGQNVQIIGDFERTHVEGNIYICGKIRAFTFLRIAIRVYFNKDFRKLIKLLKKEAV